MKPSSKILVLLLLSAQIVFCEEIRLSLDQALSLAEMNDLTLATAGLGIEAGDAQVREAIAAALPKLNVNGTVMRHMVVPTMYFPKMEGPEGSFGGTRIQATLPSDITTDASLQQPIWLAGKVGMALKAARIYRQIAKDAYVSSRTKLKSDVIREYFGLVLARQVVVVTEESHSQAERHSETVERMFKVGMASEFDFLRAQVEVKSLEPQIAMSRKNAELARISFCNRLGLNPDDNVVLTEELTSEMQSKPLVFADAFAAARQVRPEFNVFALRERLDEINVKIEKRGIYWPNFIFGLNYRRQAQERSFRDIADFYLPETFTWTMNVQIPLFDGFASPARIQKARIGLRRTRIEMLQFEQAIRLEVSNTLSELKRARDLVNSSNAALELAERALGIAETRYEQGVGTELEVLDSQLALRRARLSYLQGLYDLRVADAEYARVVENDQDF